MSGFIFCNTSTHNISDLEISRALAGIAWRGPDHQHIKKINKNTILAHCELIVTEKDKNKRQPYCSIDGRYHIVFDGRIYNSAEVKKTFGLSAGLNTDDQIVLECFIKHGRDVFQHLDGAFSLVIYDAILDEWHAVRDCFGCRPLFIFEQEGKTVISSEASAIASLTNGRLCRISLDEWKLIRRPTPGFSYYEDIYEILPGMLVNSKREKINYWKLKPGSNAFEQKVFEQLLFDSIKRQSDAYEQQASLLSGGIDSAVITTLGSVKKSYSIGLTSNNEFLESKETAIEINTDLELVEINYQELTRLWEELVSIRREPLSLPNEGLIFEACREISKKFKIIFSGEGADELLFGYDRIFRWAYANKKPSMSEFLKKYGYSDILPSKRLKSYLESMADGKTNIEFVEDFFYQVHLPGLLRRIDFASALAQTEVRTPFVSKTLAEYLYRRPADIKINQKESKIPLRTLARKIGIASALSRNKVGFSAQATVSQDRVAAYQEFQELILRELL